MTVADPWSLWSLDCPMCADLGGRCNNHPDKIAALRPANRPGVAHVFSDEAGYERMDGERMPPL